MMDLQFALGVLFLFASGVGFGVLVTLAYVGSLGWEDRNYPVQFRDVEALAKMRGDSPDG